MKRKHRFRKNHNKKQGFEGYVDSPGISRMLEGLSKRQLIEIIMSLVRRLDIETFVGRYIGNGTEDSDE